MFAVWTSPLSLENVHAKAETSSSNVWTLINQTQEKSALKSLDLRQSKLHIHLFPYFQADLADVEAEDELEGHESLVLVTEHTELLEALFRLLVGADDEPVGDADDAVEEAIEEELVPDALEEAAAPVAEDTEGVAPSSCRDDLQVCHRHCGGVGVKCLLALFAGRCFNSD